MTKKRRGIFRMSPFQPQKSETDIIVRQSLRADDRPATSVDCSPKRWGLSKKRPHGRTSETDENLPFPNMTAVTPFIQPSRSRSNFPKNTQNVLTLFYNGFVKYFFPCTLPGRYPDQVHSDACATFCCNFTTACLTSLKFHQTD